ncbi:hypothetical protein BT96DRAFT_1077514 [Gymnopus androsaceus JB14]|uniref:Peroxisome membrane anchor protein Pex14p N-terminal domain-containing protein n=1 Tax=Gymnopus androsaceus JB14 TaxID=1447944 RepID=A0A6A4IHB2_9AGAR|nr:hypothetical protein BT96DRAFT_1077514 [Gymnopus androsaceus JB14]
MAEENEPSNTPPTTSESSPEPSQPTTSSAEGGTRSELISRARIFLSSPQIQNQDIFAKRKFLLEKGLNETETELLLRELVSAVLFVSGFSLTYRSMVPPRTYPQPPPSGLLTLLLGLARLFAWVAGGSAALLLVYHRYLLPRILRTAEARNSLTSLKETQTECYSSLPRPNPHKEPLVFAGCHSLLDIVKEAEAQKLEFSKLPHLSLLRCAWEDFRRLPDCADGNPRTEELFQVMESRIPWLVSEEGIDFEHSLWDTLSTTPVFEGVISEDSPEGPSAPVRWVYIPAKPNTTTPFLSSLDSLSAAVAVRKPTSMPSPYQHTLQAMSEFTGYISSNLYTPYRPPPIPGMGSPSTGEPTDDLKKEIRALKGLVLNRKSFMATIPRPNIAIRSS